jgi:hypothetical protein
MSTGAVGLEQVGGVTHAAKGMVANADTRVSAAKALRSVSEGTHGRNYGPAADAQRAAMDTNAGASGYGGLHGAQVAESFAKGEKHVVQGTEDSFQQQKTSMTDAESTFSALKKTIEA